MIGSWKRAAAVSVLCLGLAAATAGAAQDRPQGPGGPQGPGQHGGPDRQKMFEDMRMRREKTLHDVLQIKPDQEGAFHAFVAAMEPPPMGPHDGKGGPGGPGGRVPNAMPMTTPERLDRMAARMAERQARFQKTAAATKTFYATLTPDQRRAFDAMPMMMGGGHHHGHMGGGHRFEDPH